MFDVIGAFSCGTPRRFDAAASSERILDRVAGARPWTAPGTHLKRSCTG